MRQLLDEAAKGGYGVGAFNVNDMEQIQAIMMAAKETNSPVIVQASRGARQFAEDLYLFRLIQAAAELNPDIPIAMHQDHGNSFETCKSAIELGYTSVMMDGSLKEDGKTPSTFDENVEVTRRVVDYAHERGVTVEGEIGVLGGVEDGHGAGGSGLEHITDPDQAVEFAERTGVDAWPSLSARATAHTSSPRSRMAPCSRWTYSSPFTSAFRTPTSSCTAAPPFPRNCRTS